MRSPDKIEIQSNMPTTIEMANILQSDSIVKLGFDSGRIKR